MQYSKIKILNKLQAIGVVAWLFNFGIANGKMLTYSNAYNYMDVLQKQGHTRAEAVKLTATKFKLSRRTMYNVIKDMESLADVPKVLENLLSKKPR